MAFVPKTTDFHISPYTGLTRESFIEAGEYLLSGIFNNIRDFDDPVVMPRKETKITYPHLNAYGEASETEKRAEIFEGLTRSLLIAAPLVHIHPELTLNGHEIKAYYKKQILRTCTDGDPVCAGSYEMLQRLSNENNPFRTYQQTVETCALVIGLWLCQQEIWDTYTKEEQDTIAHFISGYAHASTVPQNWRLFNMLDMAFLDMHGYPIDHEIMMDHAQAILNYYVGDGWYRDGHSFDYYSCWAFQVYAPIWNLWYGYEKAPQIAMRFEEHSNALMKTCADLFDGDGFVNMWGRSGIYRNAVTGIFDGNFLLRNPSADPGLARRISSGALLQFFTREDFLYQGVPTLGFYGQFSPLVQGYSCAESPLWLGKAFLCLHLDKDHPFWTAKENNGSFENAKAVKCTVLNGPALCFSNHPANGETILRTGKVVKNTGDIHGMWNYAKLSYNTKYPWEATPQPERETVVESQQYVLTDDTTKETKRCNVTFWHGEREGVLYRRQFFDYRLNEEATWFHAVNLADFTVPYGIFRVDKLRLYRCPMTVTLGAYGFPDNTTEITERECQNAKAMILKGTDYTGRKKQLAMTIYDGWDSLSYIRSTDTNPDSKHSIVLYAEAKRKKQYGSYESYVLISQVITKESEEDFTEEELFPVRTICYEDTLQTGGYGNITIEMKDGTKKSVCFEGIEGNLCL